MRFEALTDQELLSLLIFVGFGGLWLLACVVAGRVAINRGQSGVGFFLIAFLLSPVVAFILLAIVGRGGRRPPPDYERRVANLEHMRAAGQAPEATYPFERARLELAATGRRRVFVCGRCGKPLSLAWRSCNHCKATFDQFPPVDTGQVV